MFKPNLNLKTKKNNKTNKTKTTTTTTTTTTKQRTKQSTHASRKQLNDHLKYSKRTYRKMRIKTAMQTKANLQAQTNDHLKC